MSVRNSNFLLNNTQKTYRQINGWQAVIEVTDAIRAQAQEAELDVTVV